MISIVGVHGVGQLDEKHQRADIVAGLSRIWGEAVASGIGCDPSRITMSCAYYAPELAPSVSPQSDALDLLPDEAKEMVMEWFRDLGAAEPVMQSLLGWPLKQGTQWAQQTMPWLTERVIAAFFREVHTFLETSGGPQRTAARDEVAQTIREHEPSIVVAHSLGTIVTYETLWAYTDLKIDLLITLGSPLGMTAVRSRLEPSLAASLGHRPPGVRRWVNVADPGDPIAVPTHLRALFPDIDLDREDSIGVFSFHSATNYLKSPVVAATISPLL